MNSRELVKGDFFTVMKWLDVNDNSYIGGCMEAKVIDWPFVRACRHDGAFRGRTITLNLDRIEVKILSEEFVNNVLIDQKKLTKETKGLEVKA